jgi:thiol:disulfide interchange protein
MKKRIRAITIRRQGNEFKLGLLAAFAALLLAALLAALVPAWGAEAARGPEPPTGSSWHEGADGFITALDEATVDKKPLAVYFYTDWCGYCRQLERELLFKEELVEFLGENVTTVRINPERGQQESAIAQRYGVVGYPSLYLHPGPCHEAVRLSGRTKRNGRWEMQTADEFIETVNDIVGKTTTPQPAAGASDSTSSGE